jgi:hypothetical protein
MELRRLEVLKPIGVNHEPGVGTLDRRAACAALGHGLPLPTYVATSAWPRECVAEMEPALGHAKTKEICVAESNQF